MRITLDEDNTKRGTLSIKQSVTSQYMISSMPHVSIQIIELDCLKLNNC